MGTKAGVSVNLLHDTINFSEDDKNFSEDDKKKTHMYPAAMFKGGNHVWTLLS